MKNFYALIFLLFTSIICFSQNSPFITTWEVDASDLSITIPTVGTGYNYTVNFGDGTVLNNQTGNATHIYSNAGTYTVSILGDFPRIRFSIFYSSDNYKIKSVEQWGDLVWDSMSFAFHNCSSLVVNATDAPDLSLVTDMSGMFNGCSSFNQSVNHWDVSNVTNMASLFALATSFNQLLNSWDVSNVEDIEFMFGGATSFNQPINSWDVSSVTNMGALFSGATSFDQALNSWDVSNVTQTDAMFEGATSFNQAIDNWDISSVENMSSMFEDATSFNQSLNGWDVSSVTNMNSLFKGATFFNQPINSWDVSNVVNMNRMFFEAFSFNQTLSGWDVSNVGNMGFMFYQATTFNQALDNWDVSNVTSGYLSGLFAMFAGATSFNQPLNSWNVSNVINMKAMFNGATSFNQPLDNWDVSDVIDMQQMFEGATSFNQPLNTWDVSNVENMTGMFHNASSFNQDLSSWNFNSNLDFNSYPWGNSNLDYGFVKSTSLDVQNYDLLLGQFSSLGLTNKTLDSFGLVYCDFNTRNNLVNNLGWTIIGDSVDTSCMDEFITTWEVDASDLSITIPTNGTGYNYTVNFGDGTILNNQNGDVTHTYVNAGTYTVSIAGDFPRIRFGGTFYSSDNDKIKSVEQWGDIEWHSMSYAFQGCSNLVINAVDAPDLSLVTNISGMFSRCSSFNQDVNHWDVSNVTNMILMFEEASSFNQPLNSWDVSNVEFMTWLFREATSFNQPLDNWDVSSVTDMGGLFGGASSFNQPLNSWDVSNVVQIGGMFNGATSFNQPLDNWDVSSVENIRSLFNEAIAFDQPLNSWDVSSVIDMSGVFRNATSFNQPLDNWDVSNVEIMGEHYGLYELFGGAGMFEGATSFNQPLNTWDVSNVSNMGFMFSGATTFNQPLSNWDVSNVEHMGAMFQDASAFNQDLSSWGFNQNVAFNSGPNNNLSYSFVSGTNLDVQNYDLLLWQFSSLALTNKTLDSFGLAYCDFNTRSNLINNLGWTITGDNLDTNCTNGFITTWEVDATDLSITIPTSGSGYNYTVNFGDGTILNNQTGDATHTYANAGTYTVSIAGDFPRIKFGDSNSTDNDKIKSIESWGDIAWQSMQYAFSNCNNLVINALDAPDLSLVEDMSYMFMGCSNFNQSINHWDVSNVELMTGTFQDAIVFNQDLSSWSFRSNIVFEDTQNITTTGFLNNTDLNIQNYDLLLAQFSSLGLTNKYLGALSLEYCDFNARFNLENGLGWSIEGDSLNTNCAKPFITTWEVDTSNPAITIPTLGTGYNYTVNFGDGTWLSNQTGNVSHTYVLPGTYTVAISGDFPRIRFFQVYNNNELIQSIEQWGDIEWQNMENSFRACNNLIVNAQDAPDLSLVEDMSYMFALCSSFNQNINHWDVSNVVNMSGLFSSATNFNQPLHNWDISNVTNLNELFGLASSFNQPLDSWDVSNVTNMAGMFGGATSFNQPLDSWDVSNVTYMGAMFGNSSFNQDIGNWNVSNVLDFGGMFSDAASFNQDISSWYFRSDVLNFGDFLYDAGLDVENYDKLLKRFHELNLIGKNLNSNGLFYCESNPERNELINNLGWTIDGDQLDSNCTLSNDTYVENNLVVYPNPTQGKLFVEAEMKLKNIEVFNVLGQKINLRFIQNTTDGQQFQTDLSSIENGVYFLKIYTDEGYQIERIVKNL